LTYTGRESWRVWLVAVLGGALACSDGGARRSTGIAGIELCDQRGDEDGDAKADCSDPDCATHPSCAGSPRERCQGGVDEDGDNRIDCDDPDCRGDAVCLVAEQCGNGIDDDGDGKTDCEDPECAGDASCGGGEHCANGKDDDGDNLSDCADPDCAGEPPCTTGTGAANGAACVADADCRSGRCLAEGGDRSFPGGTCVEPCAPGLVAACGAGGRCVSVGGEHLCLGACNGPDGCRPGYGCFGMGTPGAEALVCWPRCGAGHCANGICNWYSGLCEPIPGAEKQVDGQTCTGDGQCKSGFCLTEAGHGWPGGFCASRCQVSKANCPSSESQLCVRAGNAPADDLGYCIARKTPCNGGTCTCNDEGQYRCRNGYGCFDQRDQISPAQAGSPKNVCWPRCNGNDDCPANGKCNLESGKCEANRGKARTGQACAGHPDCESGHCVTTLEGQTWRNGYCAARCDLSGSGVRCPTPTSANPEAYCYQAAGQTNTGICLESCDWEDRCRHGEGYACLTPDGWSGVCAMGNN
jgi:hypothetical protein